MPSRISEVFNGDACGCLCFACGRRLIATNGGDVALRNVFVRPPSAVMVVDCVSSGETALHIRARKIIARHRRVTLPRTFTSGVDDRPIEVLPERFVDLANVQLEMVAGELIPDVTATMPDGQRLFIEIANTYPCSQEKIEKPDAMGSRAAAGAAMTTR